MAWEQLQGSLNPKLPLIATVLLALLYGYVFGAIFGVYGHVGFVFGTAVTFVGWSLVGAGLVVFVTFTRLLSAGHSRMLVDLEQHIARLLRDTPEEDKLAFCSALHEKEDKVAGAMAVSNKKMNRAIWLVLVMIGMLVFSFLMLSHFFMSDGDTNIWAAAFCLSLIHISEPTRPY